MTATHYNWGMQYSLGGVAESGTSYEVSDDEALARLVDASKGLGSISITYRVTDGHLHIWTSTHRGRLGWETVSEELNLLANEVAETLVPVEQDSWGQIEVDINTGRAEIGRVL